MSHEARVDPAVEFYDPQPNNYALEKDPRCLFGWGPPDCHCRFGHVCSREYRHPGKCVDNGCYDVPCGRRQRPANWDEHGRAEANR